MIRLKTQGFSIVELMVAIVIGMLALMFVTRTMVSFETNRRDSLGGSDSMQNGIAAMFTLENEATQAGWGLNHPLVMGCNAAFSDTQGYQLRNSGGIIPNALSPIIINTAATPGNPDIITFYSGSAFSGSGSYSLATDVAANTNVIALNDPTGYGLSRGDVVVIAETNGNCTIAQAAADPAPGFIGATQVANVNLAGARFSRAGGVPNVILADTNRTKVVNLGPGATLAFRTWSVANGRLMLQSTNVAGTGAAAQPVVSNIVSLKAQYGFDTRVGAAFTPQLGMRVGQWSNTLIDADGDGTIGNAPTGNFRGDFAHVAAIRLAIVARSKEPEKPNPGTGVCDATPAQIQVFTSVEPVGAIAPPPITLNVAVPGDPVPWQCYHYKVFETIVPLRNIGWSPTI